MSFKKLFLALLFVFFSFSLAGLARAQSEAVPSPIAPAESSTPSTGSTIAEDLPDLPQITAQDLGVAVPRLLPDSPFYFFKNLQRNLGLILTFDPVKKADLRQKMLDEKLVELDRLAEKTQNVELIQKANDEAQKEMEKLKTQVEKFKETAQDNPAVDKFMQKFVEHGILQQKLLEKLETKVPAQAMEKIETARQRQLQRFGEVMTKLEVKEKIAETVNQALEKQPGNEFKSLKDLQFLRSLEDKLPSQAREALNQVQEKKMEQVQQKLETLSAPDKLKMVEYLQKMGGDRAKQLEILETVKAGIQSGSGKTKEINKFDSAEIEKKLEAVRSKVIEKIENLPQKSNCPAWVSPLPGFCSEGRVVVNKDPQTGCLLPAKCVVAEKVKEGLKRACVELWNPVCGDDSKTYSNDCFARINGVSVVSKGECPEKTEHPSVPAPVTP
ncbi:MAG: hypothetical protein HY577_00305 [Candidatus Nealsonbacteria bacterium]|nr:hypothetical protein [Candidatus Nealsonbacteria bacterium]